MNLQFHICVYSKTEQLMSKRLLSLSDEDMRAVLGLPEAVDLIGDYMVDSGIASRLQKFGVQLDRQEGDDCFIETSSC